MDKVNTSTMDIRVHLPGCMDKVNTSTMDICAKLSWGNFCELLFWVNGQLSKLDELHFGDDILAWAAWVRQKLSYQLGF
jgi:hypothetical protein